MTLAQLRNVYEGYVKPGYLRDECAEFNRKYAKDIERGKKFKMSENLYALDMFVVKPTSAPNGNMKATIRETACTPPAPLRSCSFSEFVNPGGVDVDFFVSHYWGHDFR